MTTVRITKVLCPCCKGTGVSPQLGITCMWCGGRERVSPKTALCYADQNYVISGGAYVEDGDLKELRKQEAYSERIYEILGKVPPWKTNKNRWTIA